MRRSLPWLFPLTLLASGCVDEELDRAPTRVADVVQVSNRNPSPRCHGLESVEVRSGKREASTSDALRAYAAARGSNYVVVDTFSVFAAETETVILTRARLFACPLPAWATR
jgi:hypothetical protein